MLSGKKLAVTAALSALPCLAAAEIVTLTFEGAGDDAAIVNFYNGGTDAHGNAGTNYGVSFGTSAVALIDRDAGGTGNFANEPSPNTVMTFYSGSALMNVAPGFEDGLSFYYTAAFPATVYIFSSPDRSGTVLAFINLDAQRLDNACAGDPNGGPGDPNGEFCNWTAVGVEFEGVARSVDFTGTVNNVGFDNVTLGASTPTPAVPEASTVLLCSTGMAGLLGWHALRRRRPT